MMTTLLSIPSSVPASDDITWFGGGGEDIVVGLSNRTAHLLLIPASI